MICRQRNVEFERSWIMFVVVIRPGECRAGWMGFYFAHRKRKGKQVVGEVRIFPSITTFSMTCAAGVRVTLSNVLNRVWKCDWSLWVGGTVKLCGRLGAWDRRCCAMAAVGVAGWQLLQAGIIAVNSGIVFDSQSERHRVGMPPCINIGDIPAMPTEQTTFPASTLEAEARVSNAADVAISALHRLEEVSQLIGSIVAEWGENVSVHRRSEHRALFTGSIVLTPFDLEMSTPSGESRLVTGRNLSLHGISFAHETPLPYRDIVLSFALPDGDVESMVTRLMWCRFTRDGSYYSGGRLLRTVESPIGSDVDWNLLRRA